ncbi:MAG: 3'-5' exonuclease [Gemmatimonadota bacterium]|nr:3'-5' exonuclease [Gemmatimonadota bacterium]MDQ8147051.1 3'-5' exonuclease [Gemmatimonadota bacterium]MDQ8148629.1 3'-5' exonuclease [Gemmatimonadota bacterium]MDQ8176321.1 3'-5' exonuclease [Gemmatimonadota bacterium]
MRLHTLPFAVVDVETTGGQPAGTDRVTELAVVTVEAGEATLAFHSLLDPGRPIPWHITRLTGIDDAMVRGQPTFADVAGEVAAVLADRVFVAHNARFDFGFLSAEFGRVAPHPLAGIVAGQLCTVRLARRLLRHLPRRNLDSVAHHYGVTIDDRHRASGDALATATVLQRMLDDLGRQGIDTWDELDRWLSAGTSRAKRRRVLPASSDGADGV